MVMSMKVLLCWQVTCGDFSDSGEHQHDVIHGSGVYKYANGDVCEGNNVCCFFPLVDLLTYWCLFTTGLWENNERNGRGVCHFANGDKFEGEYRHDQRNGSGVMRYANGAMYHGLWSDDLKQGAGTLISAEGAVYTGEFSADKKHGSGVLTWSDGSEYSGTQVLLCFVFHSTHVQSGEFRNDSRTGFGTFTTGSRNILEGGKVIWAAHSTYSGQWKANERSGHGTLTLVHGDEFEGEWENDRKCV